MNKEIKKLKIVFFGTPEFAVASLDKLCASRHEIAAVVTMPDKIAGRGHKLIESDVKKYALAHSLPVLQPERLRSDDFIRQLREIDADLFVIIAFRMLPEVVWSMPRLGTFNLHASLLPKYRGAAPINRAIMNGETETGITTFFLQHEIDTGNIIEQKKIEIDIHDNAGIVHDRLMNLGADMVAHTVDEIAAGNITSIPQPEGDFVSAPKIFREDCKINWAESSAYIQNQIRGLSPYPAAFTTFSEESGKQYDVKIFESSVSSHNPFSSNSTPGEIKSDKGKLYVATSDGVLEIHSLQPAGKRRMDASAFLLGYTPHKCIF